MPERVRITDVSPRDGLQNEPGVIPTADKARLVELLAETGVDEIEVTSFVSPKWVPQLGDAAELCRLLSRPLPEGGGRGWVRLVNKHQQPHARRTSRLPLASDSRSNAREFSASL